MLVINGIELILFHEAHQMRKFHGDNALRLEEDLHAANKIIDVRDVSKHVVTEQQIGMLAGSNEFASCAAAKKLNQRGDALLNRNGSHICSRLNAEDWRSEERRVGKECRSRWSP